MNSILSAILRRALRKPGDPIDVLAFSLPDEVVETLSQTGYRFWMVGGGKGEGIIPISTVDDMKHAEVDLVITDRTPEHYQHAQRFSLYGDCPHVCVWHQMPPTVSRPRVEKLSQSRGDYDVFTSKAIFQAWAGKEPWENHSILRNDVVAWAMFLEHVATKGRP